MPKAHCVGDDRMCGAKTVSAGLNTNVFVNGKLAAVAGDLSDHNLLGALISQSPGTILINGIPMIAAIMDQSAPDQIGLITHVTGLPTPATGSPNVNMYGGSFAGGLGNFGASGIPAIGELMSFGGNVIGQVYRTANQGSGSGMMAINNMNTNVPQPTSGSTITSANTGKTFTFTSYYYEGAGASGSGLSLSPAAGSLASGTQSTAYSQTFTASNGTGSYTYSSSGSLPSGLSLNASTGVLSGTPSAQGSYSFFITATDSIGLTVTNSYSISIAAPLVSPDNITYSTPGTYNFVVPNFNTMSVDVKGGGGGGGGGIYIRTSGGFITPIYGQWGTAGGASSFNNSVTANGGGLGPSQPDGGNVMVNGQNIDTGGSGGTVTVGGGGSGGLGGRHYTSSGPTTFNGTTRSNRGGNAGRVTNSWSLGASGAPVPGQTITVIVGSGGPGGAGGKDGSLSAENGFAGTAGSVFISWA